jgi:hypothetical protein
MVGEKIKVFAVTVIEVISAQRGASRQVKHAKLT